MLADANAQACKQSGDVERTTCNPCRELLDLERQMLEVRSVWEEMNKRHNQLKTAVNGVHDIITNRLPPEVMSAIFEFYCYDNSHLIWSMPEEIPNPLILGAVCRSWRKIAWSSRRLWTRISILIRIPDATATQIDNVVEVAREWLDRGGQLPLEIAFRMEINDYFHSHRLHNDKLHGNTCSTLLPVLDVIKQHYSRWRDVCVDVCPTLLPHVFRGLKGTARLRNLELSNACTNGAFEGSLSMDEVVLGPSFLRVTAIQLRFVNVFWNNVTSFQGYDLSMDQCIELLRLAPRLEKCEVEEISPCSSLSHQPTEPIVQSQLKRLELRMKQDGLQWSRSSDLLNLLFANVTLPSLTRLSWEVREEDHCKVLSPSTFESFVRRSSCRLKELSITTRSKADEFYPFICSTHHLTSLSLDMVQQPSHFHLFFFRLGPMSISWHRQGLEVLLPSLERLRINIETSEVETFPWNFVPDIFGLSDQHRPLKDLSIFLRHSDTTSPPTYNLDPSVVSKCKQLQATGVNLRICIDSKVLL
ncbi:hypothetical protein CVT26_005038 [Gymnopilus dilepis]|uniref:Uncharacterized protein n=1 Tax=Gymnopilus dilepis TaxID=231916 RepID=A0A409WWU1_9AGAR|nr:hypothetical protein CVT26_005038 [Gymnopilus dilepis]